MQGVWACGRVVSPTQPGGEPLCRLRALRVDSRRLPGVIQWLESTQGFYELLAAGAIGSPWVIPGSRLLSTPGVRGLQSGSPPGWAGDTARHTRPPSDTRLRTLSLTLRVRALAIQACAFWLWIRHSEARDMRSWRNRDIRFVRLPTGLFRSLALCR
jgi:hypothetical protein